MTVFVTQPVPVPVPPKTITIVLEEKEASQLITILYPSKSWLTTDESDFEYEMWNALVDQGIEYRKVKTNDK